MQVSFFEEFPTEENLKKLKLINWPTKLYIAAPSLKEFLKIKKSIKNKKVKECIYWPLLSKKEGYWISPFSKSKALWRIFMELKNKRIPVMLDLELPKKKSLYLSPWKFGNNKHLISNFIAGYKGPVYLAEYYPDGQWKRMMLRLWGLDYPNRKVKVIKMLYHSMHRFSNKFLEKEFTEGVKTWGNNYSVALGIIATGVTGKEPVLSMEQLKRDLALAKNSGVKESIIFRLGGLQNRHLEFLKIKKARRRIGKIVYEERF